MMDGTSDRILWFLYDTANDQLFERLTLEELGQVLLSSTSDRFDQLHVWKAGMENWTVVTEVPEALSFLRRKLATAPPPLPLPARPAADPAPAAAPVVDEKTDARDKRRYRRFEYRIKVVITHGTLCFRSFTKNVSLGGVLLESPVPPAFFNGAMCDVVLSHPVFQEQIRFKSKIVSNIGDLFRISFDVDNQASQQRLQSWIEASNLRQVG